MNYIQRCKFITGLLLVVFAITRCKASQTEVVAPTTVPTLTTQPTLFSTQTHVPTSTPTPTSTPLIPTPTISLTPMPTLTAQERESHVRELLQTNRGCELPCWWGIVPGKTQWEDARKLLEHLGVRISSKTEPDGSIFHGTGGFDFEDEKIYNRIGITEKEGVVESIYILSDSGMNEAAFQSLWKHYDPQLVIPAFGVPSRVWLTTSTIKVGNKGITGYILKIFYDHLGFVVRYDGGVTHSPIYHICPTFDDSSEGISQISMVLQSPDNQSPLDRIDQGDLIDKYTRTIEYATGLSLEEFYQLFTQEDKPACFDTPRDIWP